MPKEGESGHAKDKQQAVATPTIGLEGGSSNEHEGGSPSLLRSIDGRMTFPDALWRVRRVWPVAPAGSCFSFPTVAHRT